MLARAFRELENRADELPDDGPVTVVHGDFRTGNFLREGTSVRAVLDWEMVHLGDPVGDLAWFIWLDRHFSEGIGIGRLPGFDGYDETVARWEGLTGRRADALKWYQVLAGLGFAAIMVRLSRLLVEFDLFPSDSDFEHTNPAVTLLAAELSRLGA